MKKLRKITQIFILFAFFLVPIFDIFRLDLINQSFYLFRKAFTFQRGFIYLLAVLFLVIVFVTVSKWYERQFCSWVCPHNTVVNFFHKLSTRPFFKRKPIVRSSTMFLISLFLSLAVSFGILTYFINPTYLSIIIIQFQLLTVVGILYLFLSFVFFIIIYHLKQRFCSNACPYGHFQKLFADNTRSSKRSFFSGVNLLLVILLASLFFSLITFSLTSKQYSVTIVENVIGVPLNEEKIYSYELEIRNLANDQHTFRLQTDIPSHWVVLNDELIFVSGKQIKKSSLIIKVPKEDFSKNFLINVQVTNITTNSTESKNIAIHS